EAKLEHAGLRVEKARLGELPVEVVVPGRIEADVDRRIDIRPRVSGVVRSVNVVIGQKIKAGGRLPTPDRADVGTARLDPRNRQRELTIARTEADWRSTIAANVDALIKELRRNVPAATLEREYASKPLGNDRALLLSAYSDFQIAQHEEEKQTDLHKK